MLLNYMLFRVKRQINSSLKLKNEKIIGQKPIFNCPKNQSVTNSTKQCAFEIARNHEQKKASELSIKNTYANRQKFTNNQTKRTRQDKILSCLDITQKRALIALVCPLYTY